MGNKSTKNGDLKKFVKEINFPNKDESYIDDKVRQVKSADEYLRGNSKYRFQSKIVRVYICSTYFDMQNEIDYLIEIVYSKLKRYCRVVHDLQFQLLNMKVGVEVTSTMLLNEINNCCAESISPSIVVLIGNQYGALILPDTIQKKDFELIEIELKKVLLMQKYFKEFDVQNGLDLFGKFYRIDQNEVPEVYRLAEIYSQTQVESEDSEGKRIDPAAMRKLQQVLSLGARNCSEQGLFNMKQETMFSKSVFEIEIDEGVLKDENKARKALVFSRNIKNVEDVKRNEEKKLVDRYFDTNLVDSSRLLENLMIDLSKAVGGNQFHKLDVDWAFGHGVSVKTHPEYFKDFGEFFYEETVEQVATEIHNQGLHSDYEMRSLIEEVTSHAIIAQKARKLSYTNEVITKSALDYLMDHSNSRPLIIHGVQGSGKSTILSKIAAEISTLHTMKSDYAIVIRFLGKTPSTKTINSTYFSILDQLCSLYKLEDEYWKYLESGEKLKVILEKILLKIQTKFPRQTVYILLDGLNELERSEKILEKLFLSLPGNSKFIYTIDTASQLFTALQQALVYQTNYLRLTHLQVTDARMLLENWLSEAVPKRTLSDTQWRTSVDNLLNKSRITLSYLRLLFSIVSKWSSTCKPEMSFFTCQNSSDCFEYILTSIEKKHDPLIFTRSMFYLTIFPFGIQDSEMEDVLGVDRDVRKHAKSQSMSLAQWFIIKSEFKEFLAIRQYDSIQVVSWTNKTFRDVAYARYVQPLSNEDYDSLLTNIIFYFLKLQDTYKLATLDSKANYYKFNKRLLRSLPYFIFALRDPYYKTNSLKKYIYYNCDFVFAIASIHDRLFIERAAEVWSLYMYFEMEKKRSTPDRNLIAPAIELAIVSYSYQQNFTLMSQKPSSIHEILENDKKVNYNENNREIAFLIQSFKDFTFKNYIDMSP